MAMAEHNQAVVVTPFTLMGAMAPVSLAAAWVVAIALPFLLPESARRGS